MLWDRATLSGLLRIQLDWGFSKSTYKIILDFRGLRSFWWSVRQHGLWLSYSVITNINAVRFSLCFCLHVLPKLNQYKEIENMEKNVVQQNTFPKVFNPKIVKPLIPESENKGNNWVMVNNFPLKISQEWQITVCMLRCTSFSSKFVHITKWDTVPIGLALHTPI